MMQNAHARRQIPAPAPTPLSRYTRFPHVRPNSATSGGYSATDGCVRAMVDNVAAAALMNKAADGELRATDPRPATGWLAAVGEINDADDSARSSGVVLVCPLEHITVVVSRFCGSDRAALVGRDGPSPAPYTIVAGAPRRGAMLGVRLAVPEQDPH
jgi:hypothetical protein